VFELQQRGIDVRESDRGVVINLPDVLFESGTATLTKRAHEIIFEIAQVLLRSPSLNLLIEGHTDSVGDIGHNYQLSDSRARAVAAELETNGIARQTITTQAFGETSPIATNRTEQGRRLNRRVEVVIQG
jgi:outer membrane protein OmpA-like peptidoglycan-associated protein